MVPSRITEGFGDACSILESLPSLFLPLRAIPVGGERGRPLAVSDRVALLEPEAADPTAPGEAALDQLVIARDFNRLRLRGWLRGWSLCLWRLQPLEQRVQGVDLAVKDIGLCAEGRELVLKLGDPR